MLVKFHVKDDKQLETLVKCLNLTNVPWEEVSLNDAQSNEAYSVYSFIYMTMSSLLKNMLYGSSFTLTAKETIKKDFELIVSRAMDRIDIDKVFDMRTIEKVLKEEICNLLGI